MDIPEGVGPHTGRELELMLKGEKKVALFYDVLPLDGSEIIEEIIPEKAFAPHVQSSRFVRVSRDFKNTRSKYTLRCVCFCTPQEEWRAHFLLWLKERSAKGFKLDDADDVVEGRILGYSEKDIASYIEHKHRHRS